MARNFSTKGLPAPQQELLHGVAYLAYAFLVYYDYNYLGSLQEVKTQQLF
jgi:hypothetical protein